MPRKITEKIVNYIHNPLHNDADLRYAEFIKDIEALKNRINSEIIHHSNKYSNFLIKVDYEYSSEIYITAERDMTPEEERRADDEDRAKNSSQEERDRKLYELLKKKFEK